MNGRTLFVFAAFLLAVVFSSPVAEKQKQNVSDLLPALDAYVDWCDQVSSVFRTDVSSSQLEDLEEVGSNLHETLMEALDKKMDEENITLDVEEIKNNVMEMMEKEMVYSVGKKQILGLLIGASQIENHGVRLVVSTELIPRFAAKLKTLAAELKKSTALDSKKLKKAIEDIFAIEIMFDAVAANFKKVEETILIDSDEESEEESGSDTAQAAAGSLSRKKRQIRRKFRLGGGFSTNGRSLTWNRGRTTIRAKPHFSFRRPIFRGASVGFNHRFRNGRGSVFGGARFNNRFGLSNAHIGLRLRF